VRELGITDNEQPAGHDARQREEPAAGPPTPRQRLDRPALKGDSVTQSQKTRTSFKLAECMAGPSGDFPARPNRRWRDFSHPAPVHIRLASRASAK
jgi:hypothetical protein